MAQVIITDKAFEELNARLGDICKAINRLAAIERKRGINERFAKGGTEAYNEDGF